MRYERANHYTALRDRLLRNIFLGPNGLRAGWRLLIFLVIVLGLNAAIKTLLVVVMKRWSMHEPAGFDPIVLLILDGIALFATLAGTVVMARIERRKLSDYGLPGRNAF